MQGARRVHIDVLEDPVRPSQKYTLVAFLVPGHNIEESCKPGILIRGSFPDIESATAAANAFEVKLDTVVVETGRAFPACPTIEEMRSCPQTYSDSQLNEIVSGLNRSNEVAETEFERHRTETREKKETREDLVNYVTVAEKKRDDAQEYLALMKKQLVEYDRGIRR